MNFYVGKNLENMVNEIGQTEQSLNRIIEQTNNENDRLFANTALIDTLSQIHLMMTSRPR